MAKKHCQSKQEVLERVRSQRQQAAPKTWAHQQLELINKIQPAVKAAQERKKK